VEASDAVNIYVLDAASLAALRTEESVIEYGGIVFRNRTFLNRDITLPFVFDDDWYLVIENESGQPIAIHYSVT
jgi:hypothetical protein